MKTKKRISINVNGQVVRAVQSNQCGSVAEERERSRPSSSRLGAAVRPVAECRAAVT